MKNFFLSLIVDLIFTATVGALTAARVEAAPLGAAVSGVQKSVNKLQTDVDKIQSQLDEIPPAWSQILPAADRFELVMGKAAVLDRETGLVWEKSPSTSKFKWENGEVSNHCNNLSVGNRKGWKLPTIQELASLVDPSVGSSELKLPTGHPFQNVQSSIYWSAVDTSRAWVVLFSDGAAGNLDKDASLSFFVWCVRGGQGVDPQ